MQFSVFVSFMASWFVGARGGGCSCGGFGDGSGGICVGVGDVGGGVDVDFGLDHLHD